MVFLLFITILFIKSNFYILFPNCFEYSCELCFDSNYGSCSVCKKNYILKDGKCECYDSNCLICTSSFRFSDCLYCKNNLKMDKNNQCICNIENCEICGHNSCKKCIQNYKYDSNLKKCIYNSYLKIKCDDINCLKCSSTFEGTCLSCNSGYELIKGKCNKYNDCNKVFENCFSCQNTNEYINNGYCVPKCLRNNCPGIKFDFKFYECENKCVVCNNYILYSYSDCLDNNFCEINNCLLCKNKNDCMYCNSGYYKRNGLCYKCSNNCIDCETELICNVCSNEYELNNNFECVKINESNSNYYNEVINFEIDYLNKKFTFLNKEGYNFTLKDIFTPFSKSNCLFEKNNICYLCETGNKIINGECIEDCSNIQNCEKCLNQKCLECEKGYELNKDNLCSHKSKSLKIALIIICCSLFIILLILSISIYKKKCKTNKVYNQERKINNINPNIIHENNSINNKKDDEISIINGKKKFDKCNLCQREAKIISDCGCKFCNRHKINNECPICKKRINKKTNIKFECGICLEEKEKLKHFNCECAFLICEKCYKLIIENPNQNERKCPGCRILIS